MLISSGAACEKVELREQSLTVCGEEQKSWDTLLHKLPPCSGEHQEHKYLVFDGQGELGLQSPCPADPHVPTRVVVLQSCAFSSLQSLSGVRSTPDSADSYPGGAASSLSPGELHV